MQSTHPDPSDRPGNPERPDQQPQRHPKRPTPGHGEGDNERDPGRRDRGHEREVHKPPNRR